jgi:hypothetical protein
MSEFLSPFVIEWYSVKRWRLFAPLRYRSDLLGRAIEVPAGFITDLGSVPRVPFAYLIAGARGPRACCLHDYCYSYPEELRDVLTRLLGDGVFQEALPLDGVPGGVVYAMWRSVRDRGAEFWKGPADPLPAATPRVVPEAP